jgi:phosphoenolpyruvate synthase/pyruvate phosphate dikinase
VEDDEGKRLLIGFNVAGNPLEILYNRLDDETVKVFHAMKLRSVFYNLLNPQDNP